MSILRPLPRVVSEAGFTLIEMMIVIAIIGMLAGLIGVKIMDRFEEAKVNATGLQMKTLALALADFRRVCSTYPTTDEGLDALVRVPDGRKCRESAPEGFMRKVPKDEWGRDFVFESEGNKFTLKSLGKDGKEGGEGYDKDLIAEEL